MNTNELILLAEDNPDDVFIFKKTLRNAQLTNPIKVVSHGQEVIDYLSASGIYADRERFPLPFLLFLDLKMPYCDGFEVLSWIRSQRLLQGLVTVVLSGSDQPWDQARAYALGARSYLIKPPRPDEIREFVISMASRWQLT